MAEILGPETLVYFFFFVVPGFIAVRTYEIIVPQERRNFGETFVDLIAYSFLVLIVWSLPFFALVNNQSNIEAAIYPVGYYVLFAIAIVLIVFVSPILLTVAYHRIRTSNFLRGEVVHPSPTGWDWFFGNEPRTAFILFHLKSGEVVGGFYGERSAASSYPNVQQIYVEEVWELSDDYKFLNKVDQTHGAIINKEDCNIVELFVLEEPEEAKREGQIEQDG